MQLDISLNQTARIPIARLNWFSGCLALIDTGALFPVWTKSELKTLNQRYLVLKGEVKEAEQIRKSVYSILRQEQREHTQRRTQDMERQQTGLRDNSIITRCSISVFV